jgi:hypothetical protein
MPAVSCALRHPQLAEKRNKGVPTPLDLHWVPAHLVKHREI